MFRKNCFTQIAFPLIMAWIFTSHLHAQCSNQVTHLSGTSVVSGVSVTVSSFGTAGSNVVYCQATTPYIIGHLIPSGLTTNSGFTFQFTPPVDSITLNFSGISNTAPYQEIVMVEINGARYAIPSAGGPNGCDTMAVLTPQGTITGCNSCSVSGWNGTSISGPISMVTVIDSAVNGPGGNESLFSLFFCNISSGVQAINTCEGDSTLFTIFNTANLVGVQWDFGDTASGINNISFLMNPLHSYSLPGNYTVQLIRYTSTTSDTVNLPVTIHALPNINLGNDTTICSGSSLVLHAGGSYANYVWQDGSTDSTYTASQAGTYYVSVSDSTCSATDSITINFVNCALPSANFYSSDTSFCDKKCIDFFDISTNNPTSWQWLFPGADSLTSNLQNPLQICYNSYGIFDVTLIACNAAGCDTLSIADFIHENQPPTTPVITSHFDTLFCSPPSAFYQWYSGSGSIPGATGAYFVYQQPGNYYVIVTDSNGCANSSQIINTGVESLMNLDQALRIFPNPTNSGLFTIQFSKSLNGVDYQLELRDVTGRRIWYDNRSSESENIELDMRDNSDGLYFVQISMHEKIWKLKMMIQRTEK